MDAHQEFYDPVYGFVSYTQREVCIIDHPAFQRLFKVYQLGQTHLVFRGATHSRGQHSLGTVKAAELLIAATDRTYERHKYAQEQKSDIEPRWKLDRPLNRTERAFARLASLLHDIGHIVDGHTIEDELGLLHDHGSRQRLNFILDKENWMMRVAPTAVRPHVEQLAAVHDGNETPKSAVLPEPDQADTQIPAPPSDISETESLRQLIDRLYSQLAEKADVSGNIQAGHVRHAQPDSAELNSRQLTASEILIEIIVKADDRSELAMDRSSGDDMPVRVSVLRDLVGNTVCADLIDYLQRDWRHIGRPRHLDTRLLQYIEIITDGSESKLVVNLRSNHDRRPRPDVMSAILDLLENRYHLWEVALLHRTKTCASGMLERAILERAQEAGVMDILRERISESANETRNPTEVESEIFLEIESLLLEAILEVSDPEACRALSNELWQKELCSALSSNSKGDMIDDAEAGVSHHIFQQLDRRHLHKEIVRVEYGPYSQAVSDLLSPLKAPRVDRFMAAYRRLSSLRKLEADFGLERGGLVMYCLPFGLGKKLAEVQIIYGDEVDALKELDGQLNISGGHLEAQLNRYDRLWRASLFASETARDQLESNGLLGTIAAAFKRGVLGLPDIDLTMYDLAKIVSIERSGVEYAQDAKLVENVNIVERQNDSELHYATGEPTIKSHFFAETHLTVV